MLKYLKNLFNDREENGSSFNTSESVSPEIEYKKLQIATCALFLEIAQSDDEFLETERDEIIKIMRETFNLDDEHISMLLKASEKTVERSVSLYDFTSIINRRCNFEEKFEILKNLWRLIFVDDKVDAYEDSYLRKITGNLRLSHNDMIAAKIEVKKELGK